MKREKSGPVQIGTPSEFAFRMGKTKQERSIGADIDESEFVFVMFSLISGGADKDRGLGESATGGESRAVVTAAHVPVTAGTTTVRWFTAFGRCPAAYSEIRT